MRVRGVQHLVVALGRSALAARRQGMQLRLQLRQYPYFCTSEALVPVKREERAGPNPRRQGRECRECRQSSKQLLPQLLAAVKALLRLY